MAPSLAAPALALPMPPGPWSQLHRIGNTPLIDLSALIGRPGVALYAKAELANPGGSVKDRPALAMVEDAERRGLLQPGSRELGQRILDATSGNTGIALAMIGAARGYAVTLCLPANASPERRQILAAYGAELVLTDPLEGTDGAIREARRRAAAEPHRLVYLDQYGNPENWLAHFRGTGPELWRQTGGTLTHWVAGLGTTGTFVGVGRYLREVAPRARLLAMQPDSPLHGLEGLKHLGSCLVPPIWDPALADEHLTVATDEAYAMVRRLARDFGLLVGISSGANAVAAVAVARSLERGVVATVLCDGAEKYLSDRFWSEP